MSTKIDEILKPALKLRRSQRAKVAAELIASLDDPRGKDLKRLGQTNLPEEFRTSARTI
jgi:hypothetical protein